MSFIFIRAIFLIFILNIFINAEDFWACAKNCLPAISGDDCHLFFNSETSLKDAEHYCDLMYTMVQYSDGTTVKFGNLNTSMNRTLVEFFIKPPNNYGYWVTIYVHNVEVYYPELPDYSIIISDPREGKTFNVTKDSRYFNLTSEAISILAEGYIEFYLEYSINDICDKHNCGHGNCSIKQPQNEPICICEPFYIIDGDGRCTIEMHPSTTMIDTTTPNTHPTKLSANSTIASQITTSNSHTPSTTKNISTPSPAKKLSPKWPWIIGISITLIISFGLLAILIFIRRRRQRKMQKNHMLNIPFRIKTTSKINDIKLLSNDQELKMQIDPENLEIDFDVILGKGEHATVYKGILYGSISTSQLKDNFTLVEDCNVAVKLPKIFNEDEAEQFVRELHALICIGPHPNIIGFYGWSMCRDMPALITELGSQNLLQHVKSFRGRTLPFKLMLSFLFQICQALEHLASLSLIHRDVACRNVLLTDSNVAKLADFGLCCRGDESSFIYRASLQKRFPLKWLSIEALIDRIFSEKSDVWSFGILCYEVFSFGALPYPALSNMEMLEFLKAGQRLEQPPVAPKPIYELMLSCWRQEPSDRPNFSEIIIILKRMLENESSNYGYLSLENVNSFDA